MSVCKGETLTVSGQMNIPFSAQAIWPLLCPVREYDWIEPWKCEMVRSVSGFNELGCVFITDFPTELGEEVWLTSRFDENERVEFVRTNAARIIHLTIELKSKDDGTGLIWTQHVTALGDECTAYFKEKTAMFAGQVAMLERMLIHYLTTGTRLQLTEKL